MSGDSDSTHVAVDDAVQLGLFDERGVVGQGVTSRHEVLVGLLVPVLREDNRVRQDQFRLKNTQCVCTQTSRFKHERSS